jgi:hypothetical protein
VSLVDDLFGFATQDQATVSSTTSRTVPFHSAQETWNLIVQAPEFNGPSLRFLPALDAEEHFNDLVSAAADLPGDMEAQDLSEDQADRLALTKALNDVQLGLIAEQ